jgi:hypothetical protein
MCFDNQSCHEKWRFDYFMLVFEIVLGTEDRDLAREVNDDNTKIRINCFDLLVLRTDMFTRLGKLRDLNAMRVDLNRLTYLHP